MENPTENKIRKVEEDIIDYLNNPQPSGLLETIGNKQGHKLEQLDSIMIKYTLKQSLRV